MRALELVGCFRFSPSLRARRRGYRRVVVRKARSPGPQKQPPCSVAGEGNYTVFSARRITRRHPLVYQSSSWSTTSAAHWWRPNARSIVTAASLHPGSMPERMAEAVCPAGRRGRILEVPHGFACVLPRARVPRFRRQTGQLGRLLCERTMPATHIGARRPPAPRRRAGTDAALGVNSMRDL